MILLSIIKLIILAKFVLFNFGILYTCIIHIHQGPSFPPKGLKTLILLNMKTKSRLDISHKLQTGK